MTEKDLFSSPEEETSPDEQMTSASEVSSEDGQIPLFEEVQIPLWQSSSEDDSALDSFAVSSEQTDSEEAREVSELVIPSADEGEKEQPEPSVLSFLEDFDEESFYTPADQIPRRRRRSQEPEEEPAVVEIPSVEETEAPVWGKVVGETEEISEDMPAEEFDVPEEIGEEPEEISSQPVFTEEYVPLIEAVSEADLAEELPLLPKKKSSKKPGSAVSPLVEFVEIIVGALVAAILVLTLICRTGVVEGGSMLPTMYNGDRYIISDLFYTPEAGDIVVFRPEIEGEDELWIKRVVAVEGQTVYIDPETYRVYVDGKMLDEPYLDGQGTIPHTTQNPVTVPLGCVFVLGDNRAISHDSRYEDLGCVEVRQLAGRVILRFWPVERFGFCK